MITINSLEEMKPYYNEKTNTYEFDDDVCFEFDLEIPACISAKNIDAFHINAWNIDAEDIEANNIDAFNINAFNINANDISFFAICFAHKTFICNSIVGERENSKYFCLDSKVIVKGK